MMDVQKLFRKIPEFNSIEMDTILFESQYPVLFTCKQNSLVYFFICCQVNSESAIWIGTETNYDNLIALLEDEITIREAFRNITQSKLMIEYNGIDIKCSTVQYDQIPERLLPTAGEYMDVEDDEYAEEIAEFAERNKVKEFQIPRSEFLYVVFGKKEAEIVLNKSAMLENKQAEASYVSWSLNPIFV